MAAKTPAELQRERMLAAATRRSGPDPAPPGKSAVRTKMIRITIDLAPEDHRTLAAWTMQAAADLDLPVVTSADAVRAMIQTAATDPDTGALIANRIRRNKQ